MFEKIWIEYNENFDEKEFFLWNIVRNIKYIKQKFFFFKNYYDCYNK